MKIFMTGGAGFIASHIVDKYVQAGHQVEVIDDMSRGRVENMRDSVLMPHGRYTLRIDCPDF